MRREPHPHQIHGMDLLRQSLRSGHRRPMLCSPTGSGKTKLASMVVEGALSKGRRVTFVVPVVSLVDQTVKALFAEGIEDIGVIQARHEMTDWSKPVQVASVQTLQHRTGRPQADVVVIDEAHNLFEYHRRWMADPSWEKVPFIGLSATPWAAAARAAQAKWRVPASVTLAQWALESAWGKRNMGSANNCFGLKPWRPSQPFVVANTHEEINGVSVPMPQKFCSFPSIAACIDAHGEFLNVNRRYLAAFSTRDGIGFAKAIAAAGYATDPNYAGKLISIITAHNLLQFDSPAAAAPIPRQPPAVMPKKKLVTGTGAIVSTGAVVASASAAAASQGSSHAALWVLLAAALALAVFLVLHFRKKA